MFKKVNQRGRRERRPRGVLDQYVEWSDGYLLPGLVQGVVRTKLGAFFNILEDP